MPYVPPPRPPPAPRPPVFRPPVFRPPPGPSIHQQQLRMQQQQFRQQQQIRQFHQTQQQLIANQQRLQMDRHRQQQMLHQQQLQRQQQENFRRQQQLQQENLRRQQQLQHQLHQSHQDQLRRQQQLLQEFQTSPGTSGSSVFISPPFSLEVHLNPSAMEGEEGVDLGQPSLTAPPVSLLLPQAMPTNQQGSVYPPPYPGSPVGSPVTPQSQAQPLTPKLDPSLPPAQFHSSPLAPQFSGGATPQPPQITNTPIATENIIILKDGTRIIIRSKDEYQFTGPRGHKMVVNCLPLFIPRPGDTTTKKDTSESSTVTNSVSKDAHSTLQKKQARRGTKAAQRFVLQKAASTESVLTTTSPTCSPHANRRMQSSEAEDILSESGKNSVQVLRDTWSHYNSCMHGGVTASANTTKSASSSTENVLEDREVQASEAEEEGGGDVRMVGGAEVGVSGEEGTEHDESDGTSQPLSDGGSEGEKEGEVRISYIENPDEMQRLSRSSGSVSFITSDRPMVRGRPHPSPPPPSVEEEIRETTDVGGEDGVKEGSGEGGENGVKEGSGEGGEDDVKEGSGEGGEDYVKEGSGEGGEDGVKEGSGEGGEDGVKEGSGEGGEDSAKEGGEDGVKVEGGEDGVKEGSGEGGEDGVKEGGGEGGEDGVKEGGEDGVKVEGGEDGVKEGSGEGGEDGVKEGGGEGGEDGVKEKSGEGVDGGEGEGGDVEIETPGDKNLVHQEGDNHHQEGDTVTEKVGLTQSSPSPTPTAPSPASTGPTQSTQIAPPPGPAHSTPTPVLSVTQEIIATPLPPPPATFEPQFIERSGWLTKLSHRRGMFGDKWQKRYFVLHGSWLYYFKKYGDSIPRGAIRLHPGAWAQPISQGSSRLSDAVVNTPPNAVISVVRCFGVHRPDNFASSLSELLSRDGVADAFRSQTISVSNSDSCSRTFYMVAPSNDERDSWVEAIRTNITAYALSPSALETSCKELRNMLRGVQSTPPSSDLPSLLSLLHSKTLPCQKS